MAHDERISKIKTLVEGSNGGNLKRLCSMALWDLPEEKILGKEAKESFLNLAVTVNLFFSDKNVVRWTGWIDFGTNPKPMIHTSHS